MDGQKRWETWGQGRDDQRVSVSPRLLVPVSFRVSPSQFFFLGSGFSS